MNPVRFYFDFISPFGYFASLRIEALAQKHGRATDWHAILLGVSIMKVMGLKALLQTPLKGPYLVREAARYARLHQLALKRPLDSAQMDPRACARAFCWFKQNRPGREQALAAALLHAYWAEGLDLGTPEAAADAAARAGFAREEVLGAIAGQESGALLRAGMSAALDAGIFGSPTVVVDGEPFWGVQSLDLAERWLQAGGW